jgi:hypothetical protein
MNNRSKTNSTLTLILIVVTGFGCALGYLGTQNFTGQSLRQQFDFAMVGLFGSSIAIIGTVLLVINVFKPPPQYQKTRSEIAQSVVRLRSHRLTNFAEPVARY